MSEHVYCIPEQCVFFKRWSESSKRVLTRKLLVHNPSESETRVVEAERMRSERFSLGALEASGGVFTLQAGSTLPISVEFTRPHDNESPGNFADYVRLHVDDGTVLTVRVCALKASNSAPEEAEAYTERFEADETGGKEETAAEAAERETLMQVAQEQAARASGGNSQRRVLSKRSNSSSKNSRGGGDGSERMARVSRKNEVKMYSGGQLVQVSVEAESKVYFLLDGAYYDARGKAVAATSEVVDSAYECRSVPRRTVHQSRSPPRKVQVRESEMRDVVEEEASPQDREERGRRVKVAGADETTTKTSKKREEELMAAWDAL